MKLRVSLVSGLLALAFLLSFCNTNRLFEENREIAGASWDFQDSIAFQVDISDTISGNNFFLNLRNTGEYSYSNLFVFVNFEFPNGKRARDTVECVLANREGKWLGEGWGGIWEHQILFKHNHRFPQSGKYNIWIEQGMREEKLVGLIDVGLRIERAAH